jgi:hypothetical protein
MSFEWDKAKREANLRDHGFDFVDFPSLFEHRIVETIDDRFDYGETRIRCLGEIDGRVYVVIYTWRGENRRIISASKANVREQRTYRPRDA